MNIYKERFKSFTLSEFYVSADSEHPLDWNIGLDVNGNKALKLRGKFAVQKVAGTKFVQIQQFSKGENKAIVFSLLEDAYCEQFYAFIDDMVSMTKQITDEQRGYDQSIKNYLHWKDMFKNCSKDFLDNERIMGLIAEIQFLKSELIPYFGDEVSCRSWTGQELTHKDFYLEDRWYEIKAISVGKQSVKISSLEQLESSDRGYLVVYQLEKVSSEAIGTSLNQIVQEVCGLLKEENSRQYFLDEIARQGFSFNEYYDSIKYRICNVSYYCVNNDFPKLTHSIVPQGVIKAEYHLNVGLLSGFAVEDIHED